MELWLQAALVVGGLVVGLAGVHVEQPAVMLVGFVPGALAGASIATSMLGHDTSQLQFFAAIAVSGLLGGVVGAHLAWALWVFVHVLPGFLAGVFVSASALGVAPTGASGSDLLVLFVAGVVGAMVAWAVHRLFVVAFTAGAGSGAINVALLGQTVYVPDVRQVPRHPVSELEAVLTSFEGLGVTFVGLAVVFALVQALSLVAGAGSESPR